MDALEGKTHTIQLPRHIAKPIGGPVEVDHQDGYLHRHIHSFRSCYRPDLLRRLHSNGKAVSAAKTLLG